MDQSQQNHLEFLVLGIFSKLPFNASSIKLSQLLKRRFNDRYLLAVLFQMGMEVKREDVPVAIETLKNNEAPLDLILSKSKPSFLDYPCKLALDEKNMIAVFFLIKHGATPPSALVELLIQAKQFDTAKMLLRIPGIIKPDKFDLGMVMSDIAQHPDLIQELIKVGANPDGCNVKKPLVEIMKLTHLPYDKKINLLCLLLKNGANCTHLCHSSQHTTTPLHVATNLALESGMTPWLSCIPKFSFNLLVMFCW